MSWISRLSKFDNKTALIVGEIGKEISYKELVKLVENSIQTLPCKKSLVAIACKNNIDTVVAYLACLQVGHVALLYDPDISQASREQLFSLYQPEVFWFFNDTGIFEQQINSTCHSAIHEDLALCLSTSGSTGSPKLVKLTLKNIEANAHSIIDYLGITEHDVAITSLPIHYSYGLSVLNTHLLAGATVVLTNESIVSRSFWDVFKKFNVTSLSGVPYHYEILKRLRFMRMDLPSLKTMTQAGGKLHADLVNEFAIHALNQGVRFFVMYGQTEATARISYLPPEKLLLKLEAIGQAIPNGELFLLDDEGGAVVEANKQGELVYRGPNVMMGYADCREDLMIGDQLKGVLRTGDIAEFDHEGYFYIKGRLKRFLKLHGNRFSLDEIEHGLKAIGYDCICGGVDNQLIIMTTQAKQVAGIESALRDQYNLHHTIYKVVVCDHYPVSSSGKIQYQSLIEYVS